MEQSYQVGSGNAQITLNVTVGTVGVAYSEFSIMKNFNFENVYLKFLISEMINFRAPFFDKIWR